MARALKVFRTAAGFHDAYVATTSRKAALAAWGTDADLFARGMAEQVTDPKLTAAPLENPGEVIMVSRGGLAEQLKAAGPPKKRKPRDAGRPAPKKSAKPLSRALLDKAEAAFDAAERKFDSEMNKLKAEQAKVQQRIDALGARRDRELTSLKRRRRDAEEAYRDALDAWNG